MPRTIYINHGDDDFALMEVSGLVSTLAHADGMLIATEYSRDTPHAATRALSLFEQAMELASPVLDYEEAAREAGWKPGKVGGVKLTMWGQPDGGSSYECVCDLCEEEGIDPHEREVFEHWAVDAQLGALLQTRGERVDMDFAGLVVWARTSTVPVEECPVLQRIAAEG